ncbi:tyrosine-type recombinase/integrase [Limnoglobus roseus]|uniref:Site-specific integrase n=1 Tax=Limnoglobus roseus TaxID=2598579 RepID=A0A5C1AJC1_9BACT|nr:tyrosine-type recombinase/integrase [Limnoglobus roseus]QEL18283.1 site-specific integrase [Limnoglobus roseus]
MGRKRAVIPVLKNFRGYATCWANRTRHYFGDYGTPEAEAAYRTFVAQYAANPNAKASGSPNILTHVIRDFLRSPDAPASADKQAAIAYLINHLGPLALRQIEHVTAQDIKALFKAKAEETTEPGGKGGPKYGRATLRRWFANLKRVYSWAVESKRISAEAAAPVMAIKKLPIEAARRERDVEPVPRQHVEATIAALNRTVGEMVKLQLLTGMRPSDVFNMTGAEVFRTGIVKLGGTARDLDKAGVWVYVRKVHKTDRFGHVRVIILGDEAKAILEPRLTRVPNVPLFQPIESVAESYRKDTLDMKRSRPGSRAYNVKWTRQSYAQAIERAAEKAGVPKWTPYQVRHLVAVETQAEFDLDAARAKLGQKSISVAARYADFDFTRAVNIEKGKGKKEAS